MNRPLSMAVRTGGAAVLLLALCSLGACSSALKSTAPAEQIYVLQPMAAPAAGGALPVGGLLSVQRPVVQPGLATMRIALTRPGNRLDYYAGSRWGAQLPQVVDAFATQSLVASGRFELVSGGERGSGGARFELALTVRHFEAEYRDDGDGAPQARVGFECVLSSGTPRRPLGRCDAAAVVPATANRMGPIVQALEAAAQQAMAQVIEQAAQLAAAPPAAR